VGHGDEEASSFEENEYLLPTPVAGMAGVWMRGVAAGLLHTLALGWDGQVYSWGGNEEGQVGLGDRRGRPSPIMVEGLEGACNIAVLEYHSLAVTQSGSVLQWGQSFRSGEEDSFRPIIVNGIGGVRVRRVCAGVNTVFAIGEDGELFSWGDGESVLLGHGDTRDQPSPKRIEALQGVQVSSVSVGGGHALALAEDGLVYAWGENEQRALLGNSGVEREMLPRPVEALRDVHVSSVAAGYYRSYAVADTGEVWAWGSEGDYIAPLGHGEQGIVLCPSESSRQGASTWMQWPPLFI
jgi:alpha-tubulin suppressor-like RCC1 family protein